MQESIDLARLSVKNGITRIVATPHYLAITRKSTWDNIQTILSALKSQLELQAISIEVTVAAEVRMCGELVNLILAGQVPFIGNLNGKPVLLLEFPHTSSLPFGSEKMIRWLVSQNILPMIAHPERNKTFQREPSALRPFLRAGCLLQVTSGSFLGQFGPAAFEAAVQLLDQNLITILATDAHDAEARPPNMRAGYDFIVRHAGEAVARRLTQDTPLSIIES